jgi:uncharacterized membrane protein
MQASLRDKRWFVPLAGALLFVACYALTVWVYPWSNDRISDLRLYAHVANVMQHGSLPYRDFEFGYPPLAALVMLIGGLGGTSYEAYRDTFMWLMLPVGISVVACVWIVARRTRANELVAVAAAGITPVLLGALLRTHFDLVPVAITMAALALLITHRPRLGFAVLGLAIAVKGYPAVVAVVAAPWLWKTAGRRTCLQALLAMAVVVGVPVVAGLALSGHGALHSLTDQASRSVEIESTPATILFALGHLGFSFPHVELATASWGLSAPEAGLVSAAFEFVGVVALVAIAVLVWRRPDPRRLVLGSLAATVVFAATGKVLSPQYLIWAIPLFALAAAWGYGALSGVLGAAMLLTFIAFPSHFHDLVFLRTPWVVEMGLRNLLLVAALALAIRELAVERVPAAAEQRVPDQVSVLAPPAPLAKAGSGIAT